MPEESAKNNPGRSTGRRVRQLFAVLLLVLFGGPLLLAIARSEVSEWNLAASYERQLQERLDDARPLLDTAIRWSPNRGDLYLRRAQLTISSGDAQAALADSDRAVELARNDSQRFSDSSALLALALNQRAYASALCRHNLDQALADIEEAIQIAGENESFLDTRGYIHLRMGQLPEATADIEEAVRMAEADYKKTRKVYLQFLRSAVDKRTAQRLLKQLDETFAVLYHHRGELYEALGKTEEAQADIDRAKRLGYSPERGVW